jgi:menaquinone-dependent protoporphyrinogen oxidase
MSDDILVAFATTEPPTHALASVVADTLREAGMRVQLESLDQVHGIRQYRGIVLGTALHDGTWLPGIAPFLVDHHRETEEIPVWIFATEQADEPGVAFGGPPSELIHWLERTNLRDLALFAGSLQPHHLAAAIRGLSPVARTTLGDHRDWAAVRRWALQIATRLQSEMVTA